MFQFTNDCLLGVEKIDEEHRHLFELLNQGYEMLQNEYRGDKYSEIKNLLEELEEYADQHFSHEEEYMEKICDPELILQRSQHLAFRQTITEFLVHNIDDEDEQQQLLEKLINFLAKWLYNHIIASDILIGKLPPLEEWMIRENPCEFMEEYKTGIAMIDHEHEILFEIVGRANDLVCSGTVRENPEEVLKILAELADYSQTHFADEEEYMKNIGYEGYNSQKRAHEAFLARLDAVEGEMKDRNPQTYMQSLVEFLLGWLVNHILQSDKRIPADKNIL